MRGVKQGDRLTWQRPSGDVTVRVWAQAAERGAWWVVVVDDAPRFTNEPDSAPAGYELAYSRDLHPVGVPSWAVKSR